MLTQDNIDKLRTLLIQAVDQHLTTGGKLIKGCFDNGFGGYCPVNCLTGGFETTIAAKLGTSFTNEDMWDLVDGFDEGPLAVPIDRRKDSQLYKLGQELRTKYLPV